MKKFYTLFILRKSDGRILRRFTSQELSKFFWEKQKAEQLSHLLKNNPDLEKSDLILKDYEGVAYSHD